MTETPLPKKNDWKETIDAVKSMVPSGVTPVKYETMLFATPKSPQMIIEHAIDTTYASTAKIIFHFRHISISDMQTVGKSLYDLVSRLNIKTASASGSANPEFRNCWDFIYFEVPVMQAPLIRSQIIQQIKDTFRA
jgi:hypothetical protein